MANDSGVQIGARVPDFTLAAANRVGTFHLYDVAQSGPVILEFLRGTW